jgi:hypothetical protein
MLGGIAMEDIVMQKAQNDWQTLFNRLSKIVNGKSDGVEAHLYTQDNGLILAEGCTSAVLAVIDFKDSQLLIAKASLNKSITSNKWVDTFTAPASLFHDYYAVNDYFEDISGTSKVHTHMLCNPKAGTFPVFVYGNEAGGLQDFMYAQRIFLIHK